MKALEDELEKMDLHFATKKESEKWMMILGVAGIITFLAYSYLLPYSEGLFKSSEAEKNRLTKSVNAEKQYMSSITVNGDKEFYVKKYDQDILKNKNNISSLDSKIAYINSSLKKLKGMLFDEESWANFLDSIAENAKRHNIDIGLIKNKYVDSNGSFGHILEIDVGGTGDFKNVVEFLNDLEQNILVTDIYSTHLEGSDEGINADINISVWGINH